MERRQRNACSGYVLYHVINLAPDYFNKLKLLRVGNVSDISLLIDLLPCFLGLEIHHFGVAGISLGGHSVLMALGIGAIEIHKFQYNG